MALDVFPSFHEDATRSVITVLTPLLTGITDESGAAYTIPIVSALRDSSQQLPEVQVRVRLGRMRGQMGLNQWGTDDQTGSPLSLVFAERSTIELRIRARSDPERLFLADTLISGIWAAWAYDPAGNVREAIIQRQLAEAGIQLQEIGQPSYPEPTLADARPEGQIYQATVPLVCTLQMSWDTGTTTYGAIAVGPTVISDPAAYGFSVVDAIITP